MLRFDSFRRSSPRRTLSKKATTAATTTLRARVLSVLGLLLVVLMMSYYSLVNRVLEQKKDAEKSSASALLQTQSAGQSIVVTKKASSSSQEGQLANPNLQQQEQLQQHNYTMLPSLAKIYDSPQQQPKQQPKATIAYLTSITACPADRRNFRDAAAVLRHSIHLNSIRNHDASKYDYHMYAILHPEAAECASDFGKIGYTVLLRDTPVALADIQNEKYVQRLTNPNAGCCAEKEFLKLYAYTMHDYDLAVHLDIDWLLLKPLDQLFDAFLEPDEATKQIPDAQWPADKQFTGRIESMFTRDYPMGQPGREPAKVGMQGGFWIVRPNQTAFDEMVALVKQGNFQGGWYDGKVHFPGFYGAAMIQGLVGFYYGHYHPGQIVELDRCIHNQMADSPTKDRKCFIKEDCRDCRLQNLTNIYSAHFTFCGKPWLCVGEDNFRAMPSRARLCLEFHEEWHRTRNDLEKKLGAPSGSGNKYYGHCKAHRYFSMDLGFGTWGG